MTGIKDKKRPAEQCGLGMVWCGRVAGQVGDDNGVPGFGVYTAIQKYFSGKGTFRRVYAINAPIFVQRRK